MRVLRFSTILVGAAVLVYGAVGLLTEPAIRHPANVAAWLAGGVLVHDAVLAPAVFVLCGLAVRRTGPRSRRVLAGVLLVVGATALVAVPALLHGRVAIR